MSGTPLSVLVRRTDPGIESSAAWTHSPAHVLPLLPFGRPRVDVPGLFSTPLAVEVP